MDVPIQKIESNKGKPVIVVDGHTFRQAFLKKSGEISWRCTVKDCATNVTTDKLINFRAGKLALLIVFYWRF
jgi:hypothetical protein